MESNRFLPGLAAIVRLSAVWCSLFWLFSTARSLEGLSGFAALPLILGAVLAYLAFALFLRVPRPLPSLAILGAVLSVVLCSVLLGFYSSLHGFWPVLMGILAVVSLVFRAGMLCVRPLSAAQSLLGMEGCVVFFLFFLFYLTVKDLEMQLCLPLLISSLLSLYGILFQRLAGARSDTRRHSRLLAFFPLLLLLAFTAAAALAFLHFGADALAGGALRIYHAALGLLLFLGRGLMRFLLWLAALFPAAEAGGDLPEPPESAMGEMDFAVPQSDPRLLMAAAVLALLVVLGIGIYVVYRLRRVRFGQKRTGSTAAVTRQRPTLRCWLRRVLARLWSRLSFFLTLLVRRQTPQALYYRLLRTGRTLGTPRRPGESPCAYVRRMAGHTGQNSALQSAMGALALALQESLYAPRPAHPLTAEEIRVLRRGWRRPLWAARLRRVRARFSKSRRASVPQG